MRQICITIFIFFYITNCSAEVLHNLPYTNIGGRNFFLDLYLPEGKTGPFPVIIWLHPSGWAAGTKDETPPLDLTRYGYAMASIEYRLSDEAKFPAQIIDVKAAVRWLRLNAGRYNLDADRFGVWGHSAGGHLAALLGTSGKGEEKVQAVCDMGGPTDFTQVFTMPNPEATDYPDYSSAAMNLIGYDFERLCKNAAQANPVKYVSGDIPPFLIIHGKKDTVVPYTQSLLLYNKLIECKVDAELAILDEEGHDFDMDVQDIGSKIIGFFNKHLSGTKEPVVLKKSGALRQDETWEGEILITDTVVVPGGITLSVRPGANVRFRHYRGYKESKVGLVIDGGAIKAVGTPDKQIWFTSDTDSPINGDWAGITVINSKDSEFDYVIVEYGAIGIEQFHSTASVRNSIIRWNNSEGLFAETSRPVFRNNTIYDNAYHAIALENHNEGAEIINNIIYGRDNQGIVLQNSKALIEGNYFADFVVSDAVWEKVIWVMMSDAVIRNNMFIFKGEGEPIYTEVGKVIEADNRNNDPISSPPVFNYKDIQRKSLGYRIGSKEDRFLYVFDSADETRRVVNRFGDGLGLSWAVAFANNILWTFSVSGQFVGINPAVGIDWSKEYANPRHIGARGLAYDGEFFWANGHSDLRIYKFRLGNKKAYPDAGSGCAIEIVDSFDSPEKEYGASTGIATDGIYIYIPSIVDNRKLYKLDKKGNVAGQIYFTEPIGPAIAYADNSFITVDGNRIRKWTLDGRQISWIYAPAVETWDLDYGGGYLWTVNRTCEVWNDAKIFQIEVLWQGINIPIQESIPEPEPEPMPILKSFNVMAEPAPAGAILRHNVVIDINHTGVPISRYIYGQFIEHQGRCIYGGIWAEMLIDRKFYYPINLYFPYGEEKHKSPWYATEYDTVILMNKEKAFTGEHSPQIAVTREKPRGIVHGGLGLVKDRGYTGYIILSGDNTVTIAVSLVWGPGQGDRETVTMEGLKNDYQKIPFKFKAGANTDYGRLEIIGSGVGVFLIGAVSLMPEGNIYGMRSDTIGLLKKLNATIYRWPGGIFVNNYDWFQATGDRDKRPPFENRAYWDSVVESNDFGIDEFMKFCEVLDAEPYIVISSTREEDAEMAAKEIEYLNGSASSPMGSLRALNGYREPYGVTWIGIGNEMWNFAELDEYIHRHNEIARAIHEKDPAVKIIAVGGYKILEEINRPGKDWSEGMLEGCSDYMNLISEHVYGDSVPFLIEHSRSIANGIKRNVDAHRRFRKSIDKLSNKDIRIAFDEWNHFWGDRYEIYGEAGPRYYFADAFGTAIGLHEFFRNSDIAYMANTHPVNVHGQIKTTKTEACIEATGEVLKMYRNHFGVIPISGTSNLHPLDISVALTEDSKAITIGVVNPTAMRYELTLDLRNAQFAGKGSIWQIAHTNPLAYNEPDKPPEAAVKEDNLDNFSNRITVSPLSINIYELEIAE